MKSWHRPFGLPLWLIIIVALLIFAARHALGASLERDAGAALVAVAST